MRSISTEHRVGLDPQNGTSPAGQDGSLHSKGSFLFYSTTTDDWSVIRRGKFQHRFRTTLVINTKTRWLSALPGCLQENERGKQRAADVIHGAAHLRVRQPAFRGRLAYRSVVLYRRSWCANVTGPPWRTVDHRAWPAPSTSFLHA